MSDYYKYDLVSKVYEVSCINEVGQQFVDDMVPLSVNLTPTTGAKYESKSTPKAKVLVPTV